MYFIDTGNDAAEQNRNYNMNKRVMSNEPCLVYGIHIWPALLNGSAG